MTKNVGGVDYKIRLVLGVVALGVAAFGGLPMWAMVVTGLVGAIALATASTGCCPVWTLFGVNTCPLKKHS